MRERNHPEGIPYTKKESMVIARGANFKEARCKREEVRFIGGKISELKDILWEIERETKGRRREAQIAWNDVKR